MEKITRKNLLEKLEQLKAAKDELIGTEYNFRVKRNYTGHSLLAKIDDPKCLVDFYAEFKEQNKQKLEAAKELGLTDFVDCDDTKVLGYPIEDWEHDFKLAARYIKDNALLLKYDKAIKILEKNMSEEDKFKAEMDAVADLLN